jgi:hypothetical protein
MPKGLVLNYPALNLDTTVFTPSFLNTFNDLIVPYAFLEICLNFYLKDARANPKKDPLISPIIIPDHVL